MLLTSGIILLDLQKWGRNQNLNQKERNYLCGWSWKGSGKVVTSQVDRPTIVHLLVLQWVSTDCCIFPPQPSILYLAFSSETVYQTVGSVCLQLTFALTCSVQKNLLRTNEGTSLGAFTPPRNGMESLVWSAMKVYILFCWFLQF